MTENHFDQDDLFESRRDQKNKYSTFIEELEQSTQKLMNEVFHSQYVPQIDHHDLNLHDLDISKNLKQSSFQSINSKKKFSSSDFNNSKRSVATRCTQRQKLQSDSFVNFLIRNEKWKQRRVMRANNQHNKKQEEQLRKLTFIPSILKASRQKIIQPIYERCLDIQKQKQKKLTLKRIEKQREQDQKQSQYTFQPKITTQAKNRTLDQYLKDKEEWSNKKTEFIEHQKLWQQARKNQECIFRPILVTNKYSSKNTSQKLINQKVEDRLLRSLQKSIQKRAQIKKSTQAQIQKTKNDFKTSRRS